MPGHAYGRILAIDDAQIYEGWEVAAGARGAWAVRFRLVVSDRSIARALEADADGPYGLRHLSVRRNPRGQWWVDGKRRSDLDACLDIDVAATPLTNTPTIRRLGLAVGESAEVVVGWVDVPALSIAAEDQSYERLPSIDGADHYRFRWRAAESERADTDSLPEWTAGRTIATDPDGIVRDYEAFAERIHRR
jgi:uncharacterized protein